MACCSPPPAPIPLPTGRCRRSIPTSAIARSSKTCRWSARANLVFGLHVHVGIEDRNTAIHIMNSMRYFLPHILALSTNSPFWMGMRDRLQVLSLQGLRALSAHRHSRRLRQLGRLRDLRQPAHQDQLHRQRQENLVGHPAASLLQHAGSARLRHSHAARRDHRHRGAHPGDRRHALQAARRQQELPAFTAARSSWRTSSAPARYGLDGKLIDFGKAGRSPGARADAANILDLIDDVVDELGRRDEIDYIHQMLEDGHRRRPPVEGLRRNRRSEEGGRLHGRRDATSACSSRPRRTESASHLERERS